MILRINMLVLLALIGIGGCSTSQKRDVAQTTEQDCAPPRSLEEVQRLIFREGYENLRGNAEGRNVLRGLGVNIEVQLGTSETTDIPAGLRLQRSGSSLVNFNSTGSGRVYEVTCYREQRDCGRSVTLNGKKLCVTLEAAKEVETPCTPQILGALFTVEDICQTLQVVPASAPAPSAPSNTPVEI